MSVLTAELAAGPVGIDDMAYAYFRRHVLRLAGIDLSAYKSQQVRRRLGTIMSRNRVASLFEYARLLERPDRLKEFLDFFTINVSEFFRIPDKFQYLAGGVLPDLLRRGEELRVWSAGCANGAEAYSLAILLDEIAPSDRWSILATDVDQTVLARAARGEGYTPADLRNVAPGRLKRYFEPQSSGYRVKEALKRRLTFRVHDLLKDPYEKRFGLIVCRHVVIYFTEEAKESIYQRFADSMAVGGVLFVGGTEIVSRPAELGLESTAVSFYRKTGVRGAQARPCAVGR